MLYENNWNLEVSVCGKYSPEHTLHKLHNSFRDLIPPPGDVRELHEEATPKAQSH